MGFHVIYCCTEILLTLVRMRYEAVFSNLHGFNIHIQRLVDTLHFLGLNVVQRTELWFHTALALALPLLAVAGLALALSANL
jgi:hypothetical protein